MNKKYLIVLTCLLTVGLLISLFFIDKHNKNVKVNLDKNEVQRLRISLSPLIFDEFDVTDSNEIFKVVDYLNSLNKKNTKKNPEDYAGGAYTIKLVFKNGVERTLFLNMFLREANRFTYEIPYRESAKFDSIVSDILKRNLSKKGNTSIVGTVQSVESEQSGANISCVLKTEDNVKYNIDLKNAKIMGTNGGGNIIVYKEDKIKVFYLKDEQAEKDRIHPSMVFIEGSSR